MTARQVIVPAIALILVMLVLSTCKPRSKFPHDDPVLSQAWRAWSQGKFSQAERLGELLLLDTSSSTAGHFILTLTAHVRGDHDEAAAHFERVDSAYPWRSLLIEPVVWSYVFSGDSASALSLAREEKLGQTILDRLQFRTNNPLTVTLEGVAEMPFTADNLTPYMPGIRATLNGVKIVARLDTGGAYLHVSEEAAQRFGISTYGCDSGFASLNRTKICYGSADLQLGPAILRNVPVAVHAKGLSAAPMAQHFNAPMDAVIGTNILAQFLTTMDGPGNRLILSARGDKDAAEQHLSRIGTPILKVPFVLWTDHLMVTPGEIGGQGPMLLFMDTGLVVVTPEQGQAGLLLPNERLDALGIPQSGTQAFHPVPGESGLPGLLQGDILAYPVSDTVWKGFGDWGGMDVAGLLGWGYMKNFTWTMDFERQVYLLSPASVAH